MLAVIALEDAAKKLALNGGVEIVGSASREEEEASSSSDEEGSSGASDSGFEEGELFKGNKLKAE